MSNNWLKIGKIGPLNYSENEAKAVIAGYAFGKQPTIWKPVDPEIGDPIPDDATAFRWAYRSYDCQPASPGMLDAHDVTLTTAINSRISGKAVLMVFAVADELNEALERCNEAPPFWDLTRKQVQKLPNIDNPAQAIWRAWYVLMGVNGVDVAVCHKILHHKRPSTFPLLDRVTEGAYRPGEAWVGIHDDLSENREQFVALEEWFGTLATDDRDVQLKRLRLHDILLWCSRTNERAEAAQLGQEILETL